MTNIFPIDSREIKGEDGVNCLSNINPIVRQKIINDALAFGIEVKTYHHTSSYEFYLDIIFSSEQDMNYYKLVGSVKEGKTNVFSEYGMICDMNFRFGLETQIYG